MKLVPANGLTHLGYGILPSYLRFHIPQRHKPLLHNSRAGQGTHHSKGARLRLYALTQIHQAAALSIDRHAVFRGRLYLPEGGRRFQLGGMEFRIASTNVQAIYVRQTVPQRAERDQLCASSLQLAQVLIIIKAEGFILCNTYAHRFFYQCCLP